MPARPSPSIAAIVSGLRQEPVSAANETLAFCEPAELGQYCAQLVAAGADLATMVGLDRRAIDGAFAVEFVFGSCNSDSFVRLRTALSATGPQYPAVTPSVAAAQWYEREAKDLLGIEPIGHPDPRRLVLHEGWPHGYHPLRKEASASETPPLAHRHTYDYFEVTGEGIYEMGVGPIHAGVIEPGHFRFSNIGDLVLHLDARLFYTHRGIEKLVEGRTFSEAAFIVERTCGVCSVSHGVSFATAVERMSGTTVPGRAQWLRTLAMELERLYNHVGDLGNICAGTGFHTGTMRGAALKERLQRLNESLSGHRFIMGLVAPGGLRYDVPDASLREAGPTLAAIERDFTAYLDLILDNASFTHRLDGPGRIDLATATALGATGVAARASGMTTDYRIDHPHLAYGQLDVQRQRDTGGDVAARFRVRAAEAKESFRLVAELLGGVPSGPISVPLNPAEVGASALGYSESPRGANVHWLMAGGGGRIERLRIRSASFANWPIVARSVPGNVIPDFPLINKSFELCYACCDR